MVKKSGNKEIITQDNLTVAISQTKTQLKCEEIIKLNDEHEPFIEVVRKNRRRKNTPIIGQLVSNDIAFKIAPKLAFLHVHKVHPKMQAKDLKILLETSFPEVIVVVKSMHPGSVLAGVE